MFSCSPDTTCTDSREMLTLSLPTRISRDPMTRPLIGESTCTSVRPIERPCNTRPLSEAIFGSDTRMNGSTSSVMRSAILRVKYELTRPDCWSMATKRAYTSTGVCW